MHYQNRQVIYMVRVIPAGPAQPQYPMGQPVPHSHNIQRASRYRTATIIHRASRYRTATIIHRASRYRTATISTGPAGTAQLQYPPGQPVPHSYNIQRASWYRTATISNGPAGTAQLQSEAVAHTRYLVWVCGQIHYSQ
jgi:hypothetical protein